jgi:hypothetical protein
MDRRMSKTNSIKCRILTIDTFSENRTRYGVFKAQSSTYVYMSIWNTRPVAQTHWARVYNEVVDASTRSLSLISGSRLHSYKSFYERRIKNSRDSLTGACSR